MALAALTPPIPRWKDRVLGPDRRPGAWSAATVFFSSTLSLAGSRFLWASVSVPRAHSRTRDAVGGARGARGARDNASLFPPKGQRGASGGCFQQRQALESRPGSLPSHGIQRCIRAMEKGLRVNCTGEEVDGAYWISRSVSAVAIGPREGALTKPSATCRVVPLTTPLSPHPSPLPLFVHSSLVPHAHACCGAPSCAYHVLKPGGHSSTTGRRREWVREKKHVCSGLNQSLVAPGCWRSPHRASWFGRFWQLPCHSRPEIPALELEPRDLVWLHFSLVVLCCPSLAPMMMMRMRRAQLVVSLFHCSGCEWPSPTNPDSVCLA